MPVVSKREFLRLLNEELRRDDRYREGMRFVAFPDADNPEGASGYSFIPAVGDNDVFSAVKERISANFTVE